MPAGRGLAPGGGSCRQSSMECASAAAGLMQGQTSLKAKRLIWHAAVRIRQLKKFHHARRWLSAMAVRPVRWPGGIVVDEALQSPRSR